MDVRQALRRELAHELAQELLLILLQVFSFLLRCTRIYLDLLTLRTRGIRDNSILSRSLRLLRFTLLSPFTRKFRI